MLLSFLLFLYMIHMHVIELMPRLVSSIPFLGIHLQYIFLSSQLMRSWFFCSILTMSFVWTIPRAIRKAYCRNILCATAKAHHSVHEFFCLYFCFVCEWNKRRVISHHSSLMGLLCWLLSSHSLNEFPENWRNTQSAHEVLFKREVERTKKTM